LDEIEVIPPGIKALVGDIEPPPRYDARLLLAVAAPVFADSRIFFRKPVFLVLGVVRPPKIVGESPVLLYSDHPRADVAPCLEEL
jgi:hypothetical protein